WYTPTLAYAYRTPNRSPSAHPPTFTYSCFCVSHTKLPPLLFLSSWFSGIFTTVPLLNEKVNPRSQLKCWDLIGWPLSCRSTPRFLIEPKLLRIDAQPADAPNGRINRRSRVTLL